MVNPASALARRGVKVAAVAVDLIRPPADGLVVLAYHRIGGGTELELDLTPGQFEEQMAHLADRASVTSLDDGLADLAIGVQAPGCVVTFDDGTADFMEHALPVLVAHRIPVTYYIATRFIDEQVPFPAAGRPLSWSALAEAVATGLVTIGSHTHSHAVMDKVSVAQAGEELRRAAGLIEERLGVPANHFAYPKGVFGGVDVERQVMRYHRSGALVGGGVNRTDSPTCFRLCRSPIQRSDSMRYFVRKLRGGMALEGELREFVNRYRYQSKRN